ncbi:MAG: HAD-IA family hydrolase [Saccharofermentans sp.]|nr:HAD-IA family hydrolase [Saccharofermentans sp.]
MTQAKRKFDAVLFDLDGTLLDTAEGIVISVKQTIEHFGLKSLPDEEILKFIGPPIEWSFEGRCGVQKDKLREVCLYFRERYSNHNLLLAKPYDGIYEFLDFLKRRNIPIGIATYKKQDYAEKLLKATRFTDYTDHIFGSDYEGKLLKKDIIKLCIDSLGVKDVSRVLMVGDSNHDANGAKLAGASFAGVSYGFGFGEFGGEDINEFEHVFYADHPMDMTVLFEEE